MTQLAHTIDEALIETARRLGVTWRNDRGDERTPICGSCATETATLAETEDGLTLTSDWLDEPFAVELGCPAVGDLCTWCDDASVVTVWTGTEWETVMDAADVATRASLRTDDRPWLWNVENPRGTSCTTLAELAGAWAEGGCEDLTRGGVRVRIIPEGDFQWIEHA